MDTIFMNFENSKTSDPLRLLLNLSDLLAPTWNEEFELPDGSYSVSDMQDYFKYILKNMRQLLIILQ